MRANIIRNGELFWEERDAPRPGDHELLVEIRAAGINAADVLQMRGGYPAPAGSPADIPGLEFSGVVKGVGSRVTRFRPGDRVMALVGGGAHAELIAVDEGSALPIPEACDFEAAAGFPETYSTAWDAMFTQGQLRPGERVLVTGANGGVGTAAVQLAAASGAVVIASCRTADLHARLVEFGAQEALEPSSALSKGPFDFVLELVGGQGVPEALQALAIGGRIAVIGLGAGRSAEVDLSLLMGRRARIFGSTLRARSLAEKALVMAGVEKHVLPLLAADRVGVPVMATYPMSQARDGYQRLLQGGKLGKIVLTNERHPA